MTKKEPLIKTLRGVSRRDRIDRLATISAMYAVIM